MRKLILHVMVLSLILTSCEVDKPIPVPVAVYPDWSYYDTGNSGLPGNNIRQIEIDEDDNKWMLVLMTSESKLVKYDDVNWEVYDVPETSLIGWSYHMSIDGSGNIWISTTGTGLLKFDGGNWTIYNESNSGIPHTSISASAADSIGNIWVSTFGGGLAKLDTNENWEVFTMANSGLPADEVLAVAVDGDNNKWVSATKHPIAGGVTALAMFDDVSWTMYDVSVTGIPMYGVAISIDNNNVKWLSMDGIGLGRLDGSDWTHYNSSNSPLSVNGVYFVSFDQLDNKWMGGMDGLIKFDDVDFTIYTTSNSGLIHNGIGDVAIDKKGVKWIVGPFGISIFQ